MQQNKFSTTDLLFHFKYQLYPRCTFLENIHRINYSCRPNVMLEVKKYPHSIHLQLRSINKSRMCSRYVLIVRFLVDQPNQFNSRIWPPAGLDDFHFQFHGLSRSNRKALVGKIYVGFFSKLRHKTVSYHMHQFKTVSEEAYCSKSIFDALG